MKIAIVCNNLSLITGGPRLIFGLAHFLKEMGNAVTVYAPDFHPSYFKEIAEHLTVKVVQPKSAVPPQKEISGFISWVMRRVRQERYDTALARAIAEAIDPDTEVVNIHDFGYRTGFFFRKRNPKARIVWNENAPPVAYVKRHKFLYDLMGFFYMLYARLRTRKYFRAIDRVVVLDKFNEGWSKARGFRDMRMVRAGIDFQKFYAPVKDFRAKAARKEVALLAVGALNAYRRYDNVIEAVKYMRAWGYHATARIVANNIWREDACRNALITLVARYKLAPYIDLNFEGLPEEGIIQAFQGADVFVQAVYAPPPSHHGWGLVNFEAMAAGVPVVVVSSATATEVLKDGETALFFEPLHPEQIAEKIKFLVDHPDRYKKIAEEGQKYVRENQSWRRYAEEMSAAFSG